MTLPNGYSVNTTSDDQDSDTAPLLEKEVEEITVSPKCCSVRCNLAVMMFFGFAVVYGLRVNLSVAMVAMVKDTGNQSIYSNISNECPVPNNTNDNSSQSSDQPDGFPRYAWSSTTQGMLLSAFFFGYLFTQIPGGYLSGRFGGSIFLGGGVLGTAVLTLLTPLSAQLGANWLFALRFLEGFGEGVTFPAMMAMWARWAPPLERSRLMTFSGAGSSFGAFVSLPLTGFICHNLGWPAVFYFCGGAGCLWALFWFILVSDEPRSHPRISDQEKDYIVTSIGPQGTAHGWSVPLRSMVFSVPLWAIIISQMCSNWSYYTLLTSLPIYMDTVLHFNIQQNSFLSALPYLGGWLFSVSSGVLADSILEREALSVTAVRKIFTFIGLFLPAVFMVAVGFSGCSGALAVTFLTVSSAFGGFSAAGVFINQIDIAPRYISAFGGFSAAGVFINQIDIAPRYAGILLGITNTFGTVPGVVAPIVVGYLTTDKQHLVLGWMHVFWLSGAVSAFGAIFFVIFGTGKIQSWAGTDQEAETDIHS